MTTGKAIVFPIYLENVDWFLQSDFPNRLHQGSYLSLVVGTRQGTAYFFDGDICDSHYAFPVIMRFLVFGSSGKVPDTYIILIMTSSCYGEGGRMKDEGARMKDEGRNN